MKDRHWARRDRLRRTAVKAGAEALLVTNFTNVTYLTGFTGDDSYLLVTPNEAILMSDSRYTTQIEEECPDIEMAIRGTGVSMVDWIRKFARQAKIRRLGFESSSMSVREHAATAKHLEALELVLNHCNKISAAHGQDIYNKMMTHKCIEMAEEAIKKATS